MAGKKKFGAFAGVFTPSILTILGVIMYMRLGWVVGNAGLIGAIGIILVAHVIAVTTGLSVSSVATDKKIGAGGIYYVLSRSMGIPIGGAIGIALYVGTAFSIALYLIGFAESFNGYFELGMTTNDFRITGTISLVALTILALISTSAALKAQFFILAAIIVSLISIFFGSWEFAPKSISMFGSGDTASLSIVFAIFFPAVTGFTAGIAMSGDLKDPKKAIPRGTLLAIGVGLIVYIGLAIFLASAVNSETLQSDNNILGKIALWAPAVIAGIWGATLSSALGGILGGPRILQAMSVDSVTPKIFGKGKGKDNEPVNALFLVFVIAEAGILIGELEAIAEVVSMFYLATYGFINISFFLEKWANPDFQPTFKISRWIGFIGFVACVGIMMFTNWMAMIGALIVISGLYFYLRKKQIQIGANDVWQSVWGNVANKALKELEVKSENNSNWMPNILLFTGDNHSKRNNMLGFSKTLSGRTGIVTDFQLIIENGQSPLSKNRQVVKDDALEKLGIFGKKIEVENFYSGIENIASTYGFSGVEPNTVMMNWSRRSKDPERSAKMIRKLIHLDYNLLYLDYDERTHFGNKQTIDIWWRETDSQNAELMLNVARYILQSPDWTDIKIRVLFVNHNNADNTVINLKISKLLEKLRINAQIKIINNGVEQKSFYEIIELQSAKTDLILLGIPNFSVNKQADYVLNTDSLFETVGTTLLVKASNNFNELDLEFAKGTERSARISKEVLALKMSSVAVIDEAITDWDNHLSETSKILSDPLFRSISSHYQQFLIDIGKSFDRTMSGLNENHSIGKVFREIQSFLSSVKDLSQHLASGKLDETEKLFKAGLADLVKKRKEYLQQIPNKLFYDRGAGKKKIKWYQFLKFHYDYKIAPNMQEALHEFGIVNFMILTNLSEEINGETLIFIERLSQNKEEKEAIFVDFSKRIKEILRDQYDKCTSIDSLVMDHFNQLERKVCNDILLNFDNPKFNMFVKAKRKKLKRKAAEQVETDVANYAEHWYRNQSLAHNQLEANLNLGRTGLTVFTTNELVKSKVERMVFRSQKAKISYFKEVIGEVQASFDKGALLEYNNEKLDQLASDIPAIHLHDALKTEEDKILSISEKSLDQVKLIDGNSFNEFQTCQNEDVQELDVSLSRIENFIIRTSYLTPLREAVSVLDQMSSTMSEEIYNFANLISNVVKSEVTDENRDVFKRSIASANSKLMEFGQQLDKEEEAFIYDLNTCTHSTLSLLNARSIIESIDSYSSVSLRSINKSKIRKWRDKQSASINEKYNDLYSFVLQKKRDVESIKFLEKHENVLSNIELANNFVSQFEFNEGVEKQLSFYYQRLFTGSHLGKVNPKYGQSQLTATKNALNRIDNRVGGALMILGESLSGKSFFIASIMDTMISAKKVYLTPPSDQKFDASDINSAFQVAFDKTGTAVSILNQLTDKTAIIIEDLELWWIKTNHGHKAIDYITQLIEKYGRRHYFVLSCNLFSYEVIKKVSGIEKQLLSNIIITPVSKSEMKEIILNRHRTAGADIWYKDNLIEAAKNLDVFFNDLHLKAKGNIGVGLGIWRNAIQKDKEGNLFLSKPKYHEFPDISNPYWKLVLYIFVIHGNLKEKDFKRLFGNNQWLESTLKELEKTELISQRVEGVYAVNTAAKNYLEEWLKELTILN